MADIIKEEEVKCPACEAVATLVYWRCECITILNANHVYGCRKKSYFEDLKRDCGQPGPRESHRTT